MRRSGVDTGLDRLICLRISQGTNRPNIIITFIEQWNVMENNYNQLMSKAVESINKIHRYRVVRT